MSAWIFTSFDALIAEAIHEKLFGLDRPFPCNGEQHQAEEVRIVNVYDTEEQVDSSPAVEKKPEDRRSPHVSEDGV